MEIVMTVKIRSTTSSKNATPRRMVEVLKYGIEHIPTDASIKVFEWELESCDPEKK